MLCRTRQPPCQVRAETQKGKLRTGQGAAGDHSGNGLEHCQCKKHPHVCGGNEMLLQDLANQEERERNEDEGRCNHTGGVGLEVEQPEDVSESVAEDDRDEERKKGEQRHTEAEEPVA